MAYYREKIDKLTVEILGEYYVKESDVIDIIDQLEGEIKDSLIDLNDILDNLY